MRDTAFMTFVRLLPRGLVSRAVGGLTRAPAPASVHRAAMRLFAKRYGVDVDEAARRIDELETFGDFFTRKLKPGARPIDTRPDVLVSPVDGAVSELGPIENGTLIQAKGIDYPVEALLDDAEEAKRFEGGTFATLYLSPRDYHRIHFPLDGKIVSYTYLPGEVWPVNPASVRSVKGLFCLNERLVTYVDTAHGRCALVAVGATCVARIRASYDSFVTRSGKPRTVQRYDAPIEVTRGDELGVFEMGSTVILLFEKDKVRFDDGLRAESVVRMGAPIGKLT